MKLNSYLVRSALVGALGGLLFGFDTAVIAGTTRDLSNVFFLNASQLGFTVAIALWGTVVGAITSGSLGNRIGGREALRIMAGLYIVSAFGCGLAWNWPSLLTFRFLSGLAVGGSSVLGPVYIAELAPAKWRGRLVGMFQLNVVTGIVLAYISNYVIANFAPKSLEWRLEFAVAGIPAIAFGIFLFLVPRSSRWLVTQERFDEALEVLIALGNPSADKELQEIIQSVSSNPHSHKEPIFKRRYAFPIVLAVILGCFNQLAGINAILYYVNDIFSAAGFSKLSGSVMAIIIGATHVPATILGMLVIDRWGRKTLLLIGSIGCAAPLVAIAEIFHTRQHLSMLLYWMIDFIFFFSISQGAVIWVYVSEIFPNQVRAKGQAIGSSAHWIMNAIVAALFPIAAAHSQSAPFLFFAAMMVLQFFIVLVFFPETKTKTLEEIQHNFGIN